MASAAPCTVSCAELEHVGATETAYFAALSAEGDARFVRIPQIHVASTPAFAGSISEFEAANPQISEQLWNRAKKCPGCDKSCATMLCFCNGCGRDLSEAPEVATENVCMGFVYGVARSNSGRALGLSLRLQRPDVLVYDDLLARGSCHLNGIPSDCHLPDWRHLLRNAARGKELLCRLDDACWEATRSHFWEDLSWRGCFREGAFASAEDFRSQVYAGINSVPSQFQIHLQYIVPAITPSDYHHFLLGKRFVRGRWLPLEFVVASLEALERSTGGIPNAHNMTQEELFDQIASTGGPRYEEMYSRAIQRYNCTHRRCADWRSEHFQMLVRVRHPLLRAELQGAWPGSSAEAKQAEVLPLRPGVAADRTPEELEKLDKQLIQSYGRPYEQGKPVANTYYQHPRRPEQVLSADAWAAGSTGAETFKASTA